jgi:hypothetical protein
VVERLPHSRPSAYITMGLDATVVYPVVDLKIRNPFAFPIVIHSFTEGGKVTFELLGKERPAKVVFGRHVLAWRPYTRKVEEMPGLSSDKIIRKQHGIRGFKILRTRTITLADGTVRKEHNVDVYPPRSRRISLRRAPTQTRFCRRCPMASRPGAQVSHRRSPLRLRWRPLRLATPAIARLTSRRFCLPRAFTLRRPNRGTRAGAWSSCVDRTQEETIK